MPDLTTAGPPQLDKLPDFLTALDLARAANHHKDDPPTRYPRRTANSATIWQAQALAASHHHRHRRRLRKRRQPGSSVPAGEERSTMSSPIVPSTAAPTKPGLVPDWPAPIHRAAFHGPAGELVRLVEPHSEADPVAVLVQTLVMFGNCIGRTAYFEVEAAKHYGVLFLCLIGRTSKGRKGTSFDYPKRLFGTADNDWTEFLRQVRLEQRRRPPARRTRPQRQG